MLLFWNCTKFYSYKLYEWFMGLRYLSLDNTAGLLCFSLSNYDEGSFNVIVTFDWLTEFLKLFHVENEKLG